MSFCVNRGTWLLAAYVPGKDNVEADQKELTLTLNGRSDRLWSGIQFYAFPPFCHAAEGNKGQGLQRSGCSILAQSAVVSKTSKHGDITTSTALSQRSATAANGSDGKASSKKTPAPSYLQNLRGHLRNSGFLKQAVSILCSFWTAGTKNQYATYINKWRDYAFRRHTDPVHPSVSEGVHLLTLLSQNVLSYSSICVEDRLCLVTWRSTTVSSLENTDL